jgi:hypothetical protein
MSLRIRFRFDGKCSLHPRYDSVRDGPPQLGNCDGCDSLYVIHVYVRIANRRAAEGKGIVARTSPDQKSNPKSIRAHCFQMLTVGDCACGKVGFMVRFEKTSTARC